MHLSAIRCRFSTFSCIEELGCSLFKASKTSWEPNNQTKFKTIRSENKPKLRDRTFKPNLGFEKWTNFKLMTNDQNKLTKRGLITIKHEG